MIFTPALLAALALLPPALFAGDLDLLVTDLAGQGLEDAVVFVADMEMPASATAQAGVMDQIDKEFVPALLPVVMGSRVHFPNKDNLHHHVYSFSQAKAFELPLYKGEPSEPVLFPKPGVVKLGCNIHDWMSGIVLVLPNPYFARCNADGRAKLSLPDMPGLALAVFHPRLKGQVDGTRQRLEPGKNAPMSWKITLKPERRKPRSDFKYP